VAGPGVNYTVNDGSGPIIVRVVDTLDADTFSVGQTITARGAGGQFGSDFQVNVGLADDVFEGEDTEDQTPPRISRASAESATSIRVDFNEAVDPETAQDTANYEVYRTGSPGVTAEVSSAVLDGSNPARVTLGLAAAIQLQDDWTLRVRNVEDLFGNAISATGIIAAIQPLLVDAMDLSGPPFTFLPRDGETYPLTVNVTSAVADGSAGSGLGSAQVIVRIFGLDGRLVKTLLDSRIEPAPFQDNRLTVSWDGTDEQGEWVPAGAYVAHLQVRGPVNDGVQNRQIPVVVASRLDR
jgi:hypothetical protein